MNVFRNVIAWSLMALAGCGSAFAEYQTPGSGLTYSLALLASAAGPDFVSTADGYNLNGKVIISAGDTLIAEDAFITVADMNAENVPVIIVEGIIQATSLTLQCHSSTPFSASKGISILRNGQDATSGHGILINCTFITLQPAVVVSRNATVTIQGCEFRNSDLGVVGFAGASLLLRDCTFTSSSMSVSTSLIDMEQCRFDQAGCNLVDTISGSRVVDCTFTNSIDMALFVTGDSQVIIKNNRIENAVIGMGFADEAMPGIEDNQILDSRLSGMTFFDFAVPVLRRNTIHNTTAPPPAPSGEWRSAVHIFDSSAPDFGRITDEGQNSIREFNNLLVYHAGTGFVEMIGNDWGVPLNVDVEERIYHHPDDDADADGSAFRSGLIHFFEGQVNSMVEGFMSF